MRRSSVVFRKESVGYSGVSEAFSKNETARYKVALPKIEYHASFATIARNVDIRGAPGDGLGRGGGGTAVRTDYAVETDSVVIYAVAGFCTAHSMICMDVRSV